MSCVHVAPISYAFPVQTRQFNKASTFTSRTFAFTVPYFRRHFPTISLKSTSLKRRYKPLATMCSQKSMSLTSEYGQSEPVFGGKDMSEIGNEAFSWKAIEKPVGSFAKGMSVEDLLKDQILKKEYYNGNGDGSGRKPPGGGGGGGFGIPGDEGMWEEFKQVTLATLGIVFVCIYIAERAQINALAKDSLQCLFTGKQSNRLKRVLEPLKKLVHRMRGEEYYDPNQLEHEIISTRDDDHDSDDEDDDDD